MKILPSGFNKFSSDYWLNPPEEDVPYCNICEEEMDIGDDGSATCLKCGYRIPPTDREEIPVELEGLSFKPEVPSKCPHGNEWSECNQCMIESDRAYDEKREGGMNNSKMTIAEWKHIGEKMGWGTDMNEKTSASSPKMIKQAGETPFTDDEAMALKRAGSHYNLVASDLIEICNVRVQKNGEGDFSIYDMKTRFYETSNDFNAVVSLVKKWNSTIQ